MIALSPSGVFTYVLKEEREIPWDQVTVWKLRALDDEELEMAMQISMAESDDAKIASGAMEILKAGLEGWERLRAPVDGKLQPVEVEYEPSPRSPLGRERRIVRRELLRTLPLSVRVELIGAVIQGQQILPGDVGKSSSPQN